MVAAKSSHLAWAVALGAIAMWLMLPRGGAKGRRLRRALGVAALAAWPLALIFAAYGG